MDPQRTARFLHCLVGALVRLPWPWLYRCADALAWLGRKRAVREARVAWRNLELAYPELLPAEREALHRALLRTTARQTLETLRFWTRPNAENLGRIREFHDAGLYDRALAEGRGVIVAAPHFGNWELLNPWLASRGPIAIVYRPPESAVGDAFLLQARGAEGVRQVRAEGPAVRQLWKVLKDGGAVGILPDQQPKAGDGEFAPFFGVQALTMTLLPRLAERTGAPVLFAWCERIGRADDGGPAYALHMEPAPADIADPDPVRGVTALNRAVEHIARRDPAQYQWTYKRYTLRPPDSGETTPYGDPRGPKTPAGYRR